MSSDVIRLTLRSSIDQPVEIDGLTPDRTAMLSEAEISTLPVFIGSRRAALGDFFVVDGERSNRLHIDGDLRNVSGLGAAMTSGELLVHGSVGGRVGAGMTGGSIEIDGDAGDRLGAAPAGAAKGMTGGEIAVSGSAGTEVAARARRGLVAVGGDVGADAARAIIAGTLVVFGRIGTDPGRGSKRGSIVALGEIEIPSTYEYACTYQPTYVRMLLTYLSRRYGMTAEAATLDGPYARYCGDAGHPGKGEILAYTPANR